MDFEQSNTSLIQRCSDIDNALVSECTSKCALAEFQSKNFSPYIESSALYVDPVLATPILRPMKQEVEIPPLEDFPSPAIPLSYEPLNDFVLSQRIENFHLSPNIDMKVEKLQISSTSKKITSDKVSGTPNINNEFSSDLQSLSTLASSNKIGHKDITLLYSDDEFEELQGNLAKSAKPSHSPERKMSNEDEKMLPPRAQDCDLLRAPFASNLTFASNTSKSSQQSPKPMTILEFLQKSTNSLLQYDSKKRVEKADSLCKTTFSLISSSGKSGAILPNLTLG